MYFIIYLDSIVREENKSRNKPLTSSNSITPGAKQSFNLSANAPSIVSVRVISGSKRYEAVAEIKFLHISIVYILALIRNR